MESETWCERSPHIVAALTPHGSPKRSMAPVTAIAKVTASRLPRPEGPFHLGFQDAGQMPTLLAAGGPTPLPQQERGPQVQEMGTRPLSSQLPTLRQAHFFCLIPSPALGLPRSGTQTQADRLQPVCIPQGQHSHHCSHHVPCRRPPPSLCLCLLLLVGSHTRPGSGMAATPARNPKASFLTAEVHWS